MKCACFSAECDDGDCEILSDTRPTARKEHRCGECGRSILAGETYRLEKEVFDGVVTTHKTCTDCNSVRENLVCSFFWGHVWELVEDSLCECGGHLPWAKIGKLMPRAKERILNFIDERWEGDLN